jgi:ABC-type dipeptide/oligopeptide/nickel transport system permease component
MPRYISRRVLQAVISLVGVAIVVFIITQLLPGDAARVEAGQYASQEQIDALRHQYGLDRPLIAQFGSYFGHLLRFDFGTSTRTQQPVAHELFNRLPASLELSVGALIVALIVGLSVGIISARYPGKAIDGIGKTFTILTSSMATFWIGLLAVLLFCNTWGWLPSPVGRLSRGYNPPTDLTGSYVLDSIFTGNGRVLVAALRQLALPCLVLGFVAAPSIIKNVRAATISALSSDYARTSYLFGYSSTSILFRDGLRNSLLPVLTTVGIVTGYLLGGNVIIEQIFSWPGIGQYAYQALKVHDLPALRGYALLVGGMYVLINMVLDILYTVVDPRVQLKEMSA